MFWILAPAVLAGQDRALCSSWGQARQIGILDPAQLPEASGLAVSTRFANRFYHIDDSSTTIHITDPSGRSLGQVSIVDAEPTDVEDLALGPCGATTCLFVADIGDNGRRREVIEVFVVEERLEFPPAVAARQKIRLRYPDGPQDAEALAVRPDGTILVISRNFAPESARSHAELFQLPAERWTDAQGEQALTLEHLASIELRQLAPDLPGRIVTAMDVSEDNQRMLVLTYGNALEFELDAVRRGRSTEEPFLEGDGVRRIALEPLPQQEGVAYLPGDRAFVYTSEAPRGSAPIMRVDCSGLD